MWRENGFRVMQVDAWKEEERWQDKLRVHIAETSAKHDTSEWRQKGKGTSPMMEPIPMLDTPDFDLGDIQEDEK